MVMVAAGREVVSDILSLLCGTCHREHEPLHRGQPDRSDCRVGWRTIPGVCLLRAIECKDNDPLKRCVAVKAFYLTARNEKMIMVLEGTRVSCTFAP